jgi:hypothetical protein
MEEGNVRHSYGNSLSWMEVSSGIPEGIPCHGRRYCPAFLREFLVMEEGNVRNSRGKEVTPSIPEGISRSSAVCAVHK